MNWYVIYLNFEDLESYASKFEKFDYIIGKIMTARLDIL